MLKRWLHDKIVGHKWTEMVFVQRDPEGVRPPIYTLFGRCNCDAVRSAQVAGDPLAMKYIDTTDLKNAELDALRSIVGAGTPSRKRGLAEADAEFDRFRREAGLPPV